MARRDQITTLYDIDKIKAEHANVMGLINEYVNQVSKVQEKKAPLEKAQKPSEMITGLQELAKAQAQQNKTIGEGVKATEKMKNTQRELDKAFLEGRVERQKYNAELKKEIDYQNSANGSIEEARAKIRLYTAERNKQT